MLGSQRRSTTCMTGTQLSQEPQQDPEPRASLGVMGILTARLARVNAPVLAVCDRMFALVVLEQLEDAILHDSTAMGVYCRVHGFMTLSTSAFLRSMDKNARRGGQGRCSLAQHTLQKSNDRSQPQNTALQATIKKTAPPT